MLTSEVVRSITEMHFRKQGLKLKKLQVKMIKVLAVRFNADLYRACVVQMIPLGTGHYLRRRGDNTFGSVRLFVHLSSRSIPNEHT